MLKLTLPDYSVKEFDNVAELDIYLDDLRRKDEQKAQVFDKFLLMSQELDNAYRFEKTCDEVYVQLKNCISAVITLHEDKFVLYLKDLTNYISAMDIQSLMITEEFILRKAFKRMLDDGALEIIPDHNEVFNIVNRDYFIKKE